MTMVVSVSVADDSAYTAEATVQDRQGRVVYPAQDIRPGQTKHFGLHAGTQLLVTEQPLPADDA